MQRGKIKTNRVPVLEVWAFAHYGMGKYIIFEGGCSFWLINRPCLPVHCNNTGVRLLFSLLRVASIVQWGWQFRQSYVQGCGPVQFVLRSDPYSSGRFQNPATTAASCRIRSPAFHCKYFHHCYLRKSVPPHYIFKRSYHTCEYIVVFSYCWNGTHVHSTVHILIPGNAFTVSVV